MKKRIDNGRLAIELAGLPHLDRQELAQRWLQLYGTEPPARIGNNFLIRAIAYRLQEQALGGLKPITKQFLTRSANNLNAGQQKLSPPSPVIKPGTRLLRDWHGITYEVLILEQSILFKGKQYRSLTEVAKIITGAKWSGPAFFGLKTLNKNGGRKIA